jgi:hypothetical protein
MCYLLPGSIDLWAGGGGKSSLGKSGSGSSPKLCLTLTCLTAVFAAVRPLASPSYILLPALLLSGLPLRPQPLGLTPPGSCLPLLATCSWA